MTTTPTRARRRAGVLMATALALAAFAAPGAAHAAGSTTSCSGADQTISHSSPQALSAAEDAIACMTNEARKAAGLQELTVDPALTTIARTQATDFAAGSDAPACRGVTKVTVCWENLVTWKPGSAATAQQLFDWWMGVPEAKDRILNADVTKMGTGVANGNHTDGASADGATADLVMVKPDGTTPGNPPDNGNGNPPDNGNGNPPANGDCTGTDTPITQANLAAAEDTIACLTNLERKKAGLTPLTINDTLRGTARAHSQDMVQRKYFNHTDPDKKEPCDRILAAGYPTKCFFDAANNKNLCWTDRCGENIAYNGAATPNNIMYDPQYGWMTHLGPDGTLETNGHRKAILNPNFKDLGVGAAAGNLQDGSGATITENFGSPA